MRFWNSMQRSLFCVKKFELRSRIKILVWGSIYFCKTVALVLRYGIFHQPILTEPMPSRTFKERCLCLSVPSNIIQVTDQVIKQE